MDRRSRSRTSSFSSTGSRERERASSSLRREVLSGVGSAAGAAGVGAAGAAGGGGGSAGSSANSLPEAPAQLPVGVVVVSPPSPTGTPTPGAGAGGAGAGGAALAGGSQSQSLPPPERPRTGSLLPYFSRKRKANNYSMLSAQLSLACADKKGGSKQLQSIFHELAFYRVRADLLPSALAVLHNFGDDRKVLRFAHYILAQIAIGLRQGTVSLNPLETTNLREFLELEATHAYLPRRLEAIRTLSLAVPPTAFESTLLPVLESILGGTGTLVGAQPKGKRRSLSFIAKTLKSHTRSGGGSLGGGSAERGLLQGTVFLAMRQACTKPHARVLDYLYDGVACEHAVGARHALALLHQFLPTESDAIVPSLAALIPTMGQGGATLGASATINTGDPAARMYLAKICGFVCRERQRPSDWCRELYWQFLTSLIMDPHARVQFTAVHEIAHCPWLEVKTATVMAGAGSVSRKSGSSGGASTKPLLSAMAERIGHHLGAASRPIVHAACRHLALLSRRQESETRHAPIKPKDNVLYPLVERLRIALQSPSWSTRVESLKALMWLTPVDQFSVFCARLNSEAKRSTHAAGLATLLEEMQARVEVSPARALDGIRTVIAWYALPTKGKAAALDTTPLLRMFAVVVRSNAEVSDPAGRDAAALRLVFDGVFELLEGANVDNGDRMAVYSFLGEHGLFLAHAQSGSRAALERIVGTLEHACIFSPWETRTIAIVALAHLACESSDPAVQARIGSFAADLCQHPALLLAPVAEPLATLLAHWARGRAVLEAIGDDAAPSRSRMWALWTHHCTIVRESNKIGVPVALPLGAESKRLLAACYEIWGREAEKE